MNALDLTKLVSLILAISVAGERLVTFLKTLIPWLASPVPTATPDDSTGEIARKAVVMVIAFLSCWLTAVLAGIDSPIKPPIIGLLASGGSAFWTNILNYVKGVGDVKSQQGVQAKINVANGISANQDFKSSQREDLALQRLTVLPQPDFKL